MEWERPAAGSGSAPGPLAGIRVLEVGQIVAGPLAASLLGDLGADVIRIDRPGKQDVAQRTSVLYGVDVRLADGRNTLWEAVNRNKRVLTLDVHDQQHRSRFDALVAGCDVFVTNLRSRARAAMRMSEADLRTINPRLVYAVAEGMGSRGPRRDDAVVDIHSLAYSGLLHTVAAGGTRPHYLPGAVGDVLTAGMVAFGVLAALRQREHTGQGVTVRSSQLLSLAWLQSLNYLVAANFATTFPAVDRADTTATNNLYQCADGAWIALGSSREDHWPLLCQALAREDLLHRPEFATAADRTANQRQLIGELDRAFANQPRDRLLDRLRQAGLSVMPVQSVLDAVTDEHVAAEGVVVDVDGVRMVRPPFQIDGWEPEVNGVRTVGEAGSGPLGGART